MVVKFRVGFVEGYSAIDQDCHVPSVTLQHFFGLHHIITLLMSLLPEIAEVINRFVFTTKEVLMNFCKHLFSKVILKLSLTRVKL